MQAQVLPIPDQQHLSFYVDRFTNRQTQGHMEISMCFAQHSWHTKHIPVSGGEHVSALSFSWADSVLDCPSTVLAAKLSMQIFGRMRLRACGSPSPTLVSISNPDKTLLKAHHTRSLFTTFCCHQAEYINVSKEAHSESTVLHRGESGPDSESVSWVLIWRTSKI